MTRSAISSAEALHLYALRATPFGFPDPGVCSLADERRGEAVVALRELAAALRREGREEMAQGAALVADRLERAGAALRGVVSAEAWCRRMGDG